MCKKHEQDITFARRIREYYYNRLGVQFITNAHGFLGFSVRGTDLTIEELYVDPGTNIVHTLALVRHAVKLGRSYGCTQLLGGNESALPTYDDIKKLHTWFGMTYLENNGTMEIWSKPI